MSFASRLSKLICFALVTAAVGYSQQPRVVSAAIQNGDTVIMSGPAGVGGGGVFKATATLHAGGTETFKTFCVERNENITLNSPSYTVSVNNGAVLGGESGQDPAGSKYDPLSDATKWFYGQYSEIVKGINVHNTLANDGFNANSSDWTNALQLVIWRLEGEVSVDMSGNWNDYNNSEPMSVSSGSAMAIDANKLWDDFYKTGIANAGDFHVKVLNLWIHPLSSFDYQHLDDLGAYGTTARNDASANNNKAQSQLYYDATANGPPPPVPEPGAMLIWSSLGGLGLAFNRFRSRRKLHSSSSA